MTEKSSNWKYVPADIFTAVFGLPIIAIIAILAGFLLPIIEKVKSGQITGLFYAAMVLATTGILLLFLARIPLYRQRRFWTLGPRHLDKPHRRLYWTSYALLFPAIILLALINLAPIPG